MTDPAQEPTQADFVLAAEILDNLPRLVVAEAERRNQTPEEIYAATGVSTTVITDCHEGVQPTGESARRLLLWLGGVV
jgi:hypothetical protein